MKEKKKIYSIFSVFRRKKERMDCHSTYTTDLLPAVKINTIELKTKTLTLISVVFSIKINGVMIEIFSSKKRLDFFVNSKALKENFVHLKEQTSIK
jgi:hypothetical protein